jgi:hypothetical protein
MTEAVSQLRTKATRGYRARDSRWRALVERDLGQIPRCENPQRRRACARNFRAFCDHYYPAKFDLAWSRDHLTILKQIQDSVLKGGLFATAMPRGSGKTTLCAVACEWAILYGHRSFVALIGSDEGHATQLLEGIKTDLETNDVLLADFPEACVPVRGLEGIPNRAKGQIIDGQRTRIAWSAGELIMPSLRGSPSAGAIVKVAGLTGGFRGLAYTRPDGKTVRPSLVLIDDPQTDESARSPSQCEFRERILNGAVLGLAGPGKKIAGLMPCTVIRPGDLADRILDRDKNPDWNGTRTRLIYSFPTSDLWKEYGKIRAESLKAGRGGLEATEFYRENRATMDEGGVVAWAARFNPDEISALQHAMNLRLRDERAFFSEYQNDPLPEAEASAIELSPDQIASKLNGQDRFAVPLEVTRLTAFIDVHKDLLYYVVAAWAADFTGYVIDYGAYPEQRVRYWTLTEAAPTLAQEVKAAALEGHLYGGLGALAAAILGRDWIRADGAPLRVERCLIDAGWGYSTPTVDRFCLQSPFAAVLMPSHGRYLGAGTVPMREWGRKPGDYIGLNWRVPNLAGTGRPVRHVSWDANWWKSFLTSRLGTAMGDQGCLSFWGHDPIAHRMIADHCTSEYRVRTQGRGREVDEWKSRPGRPDNHLFDCLVGVTVAASMQGVKLGAALEGMPGAAVGSGGESSPPGRPRPSFQDQWKTRRRIEPNVLRQPRPDQRGPGGGGPGTASGKQ